MTKWKKEHIKLVKHSGSVSFSAWMFYFFVTTCLFVSEVASYSCPAMCVCETTMDSVTVDCTARNVSFIPSDLDLDTFKL